MNQPQSNSNISQPVIFQAIEEARAQWMSRVLNTVMPDELYEAVESVRRGERKGGRIMMRAQRWMASHKIKQVIKSEATVLEMDGKEIARWTVRFNGGKMEACESTTEPAKSECQHEWSIALRGSPAMLWRVCKKCSKLEDGTSPDISPCQTPPTNP